MRYAQGGGLTAQGRARREQVRLEAARRFGQGASRAEVARELRVTPTTASRWYKAWKNGGSAALASKGPAARPRLDDGQTQRLELELGRGPLAHGWADQRWTLARIRDLIRRLFDIDYTVPGVWYLMDRLGWSAQKPARQAIERDPTAVEVWKKDVGPSANRPRRPRAPGSSSKANPGTT